MHKNLSLELCQIQRLQVNGVNLGVVQYVDNPGEGAGPLRTDDRKGQYRSNKNLPPQNRGPSVGIGGVERGEGVFDRSWEGVFCPPTDTSYLSDIDPCGRGESSSPSPQRQFDMARGEIDTPWCRPRRGVDEGLVPSRPLRSPGAHRATLVLLHGFTGSAIGWGHIMTELAATGLHIVAFDMLGHGQSDAPADAERYSIEHCQEDIIAALQTLGIERGEAILLGYSMGGRIALYSAFSGYFRALILESASPGLATPAERRQRRASDEVLATRIEQEGVEAFIDYWEQIPLFASQQQLSTEQREALRAQRLNNRAQGLANSLRGVGTGMQPELYTRLPTLNLPVLLLAGELDSKFSAIARQMVLQLPQAILQIIPEAGHTIHLEQTEAFVASVGEFLFQSVGTAARPCPPCDKDA